MLCEDLGELVRGQHEAVLVWVQEAVCDRLARCHRCPAEHMLPRGRSTARDAMLSAHLLLAAPDRGAILHVDLCLLQIVMRVVMRDVSDRRVDLVHTVLVLEDI